MKRCVPDAIWRLTPLRPELTYRLSGADLCCQFASLHAGCCYSDSYSVKWVVTSSGVVALGALLCLACKRHLPKA